MSWANLDDRLHAHPKVRRLQRVPVLGAEAFGIWCWCLSWCRAYSPGEGRVCAADVAVDWGADPDHMDELFALLAQVRLVDELGDGVYGIHDWSEWQHSQQARAGRARAASATRERGRFTSALETLVEAGDQPATPLPHHTTTTSTPAGEREGWSDVGPLVSELTGVAYPSPDSKFAAMLMEDVQSFGLERVTATARAVAEAMDGKADFRALAFGVRGALRPPPDGRKVAAVERQAEEERAHAGRLEATQRRIAEMRDRMAPA